MLGDLYAYYSTVGAGVAGLPLYDTLQCPPIDQTNSCTYDFFDKSYVLFAYSQPLLSGQNFTIRNVAGSTSILFYTEWTARGGISGLGRPVDAETAITAFPVPPATTGTTATTQPYLYGAIYSITSGLNRNTLFTVMQPIYGVYVNATTVPPAASACRRRRRLYFPMAITARPSKAASYNTRQVAAAPLSGPPCPAWSSAALPWAAR